MHHLERENAMANEITLTAALRSNLLSLQSTQRSLDTVQQRLATGKKVNTALDNANSFFAAQSLSNRAGDLSNLLDGIGQSIQVLKAADTGITTLSNLIAQAKSIAQAGRDSVTTSGAYRSGDIRDTGVSNIVTAGFVVGNTFTLTSNAAGVAAATITIAAGSLQSLADQINGNAGFTAKVVDSATTTGVFANGRGKRLEIRATNGDLTIANGTGTPATLLQSGFGAGATVGSRLDSGLAYVPGATISATSNTQDQISLQKQYDAVRTQINQLVSDTGYRGTNLLNGDSLRTQFNEGNTSSQTVSGVTFDAAGLGIGTAADFRTSALIDTALVQVTTAASTLRSQAQIFGNNLTIIQTRQDFTENLVNTLREGAGKLTIADKNEEGANLLSLQTAQQLGVTALSLASQSSQSVLRLFQ